MLFMHIKHTTKELTVSEFAERLGVSRDMVIRWWRNGLLKGKKQNPFARNSPVFIPSSELDRMMKVYASQNS
jgi:predicted site-specific integrase-resolvase